MKERTGARGRGLAGRVGALILLATGVVWIGRSTTDALQDGPTPTADVPRPAACRVEPRPLPLFSRATPGAEPAATPVPLVTPTPFAMPAGQPADEATVAAVTATIRESLACRNAGDYARAYALVTDRFLRALLGGPDTIPPEIAAALAESPRRAPRAQRIALAAVSDVRVLADGRVGAMVETRNAEESFTDYLILVRTADRWLIDESVEVSTSDRATPTP